MKACKLCIALLLASLASSSTQQGRQIDPEIERKINEYINNVYLPEANVTTLALAIVQNDGEIFYSNGYGWANEEKQLPNTNDTQFLVGSISKSFTSVVLIKTLHEKFPNLGEAVLDTPIRQLIPEFNFTLIDRFRSEHGNVRDLLAHRMCLPQSNFLSHADAIGSSAEVAYRQRYNEEACDIRTDFIYHNQIYVLAGEILSHLTGKSFEETAEEFLKELGMERSHFIRRTDDLGNTPEIARPYYKDFFDGILRPTNPEILLALSSINAAGGLLTSPNEMERYLRFHMNLGNLDGKQIVPEEVILWMRKPATFVPPTFNGFAYGQGLVISQYREWEYIHHAGSAPPYGSLMSFFPAQNLSIFTSSNIGPLQMDPTVLHTFIFETLNGAEDAEERAKIVGDEWKSREEKKKEENKEEVKKFLKDHASRYMKGSGREDEEPLGKYGNGALGELEIVRKENENGESKLYMMYGKHGTGWLEPLQPGVSLYVIVFDTAFHQHFYGGYQFWLGGDLDAVGIMHIGTPTGPGEYVGLFKAGVSLDKLPPVPWLPGSC